jgi:hypothetical protein
VATKKTPRDHFDAVVAHFARKRGVAVPSGGSGFGKAALRVDGKIFAMLVRDEFVVKLPSERVAKIIAARGGRAFDANKGTPMKEWLVVATPPKTWLARADEALAFVRD